MVLIFRPGIQGFFSLALKNPQTPKFGSLRSLVHAIFWELAPPLLSSQPCLKGASQFRFKHFASHFATKMFL